MNDTVGGDNLRSGPKYMAKADMEKRLPKRFYKEVSVSQNDDGFLIQLDGRMVKTPSKDGLILPTKELAEAVAREWEAQDSHIDPETMLVTKLSNTALDRVRGRENEIIGEIVSYLGSDLLCYRSENPQELIERQEQLWDPVLDLLHENLGVRLKTTSGIIHITQPEADINKAAEAISDYSIFELSALHNMTTLLGSAALSITWSRGFISSDEAWKAATVDDDWQTEKWGNDPEAEAQRKNRHKMMVAITEYYRKI